MQHLTRPLSQCEPYKEFSYRLKVNKFGALTTSELVFQYTQNDKPNNVWSDLKHLGICERNSDANQHEGIMHCSSFVVSVSSSVVSVPWLFFLIQMISHCVGSSLSPYSFHVSSHRHGLCALCVSLIASTPPFNSSSWSPSLSDHPVLPSARQLHLPGCGGHPLCNSAEDLGTLAENEPPTGYEPNEYHMTEAYVEYNQESLGEQRFLDDFDYDDVTIGKTLLDACRRRADHSEEEGLSSCLSSSVSHDRKERPVVCSFDSQVSSVQETQRHNSESKQIRILMERQREQILADCQAEIRKHEFQADYDKRSIQKLKWSSRKRRNLSCSSRRRTTSTRSTTSSWTIIGTKSGTSWSSYEKPQWNGRIEEISRLNIRDTILELTGKIQELQYESNCITRWTFPRCQLTSVFPTSSSSWWNAKPFWESRAEKMGRQVFGTRMEHRETLLQIQQRLLQHLIRRSWIHGVLKYQNTHHHMWWVNTKHHSRIRDASQDRQPEIQASPVRVILQRTMGQTNNDCRSQIFISINSPRQQRSLVGR